MSESIKTAMVSQNLQLDVLKGESWREGKWATVAHNHILHNDVAAIFQQIALEMRQRPYCVKDDQGNTQLVTSEQCLKSLQSRFGKRKLKPEILRSMEIVGVHLCSGTSELSNEEFKELTGSDRKKSAEEDPENAGAVWGSGHYAAFWGTNWNPQLNPKPKPENTPSRSEVYRLNIKREMNHLRKAGILPLPEFKGIPNWILYSAVRGALKVLHSWSSWNQKKRNEWRKLRQERNKTALDLGFELDLLPHQTEQREKACKAKKKLAPYIKWHREIEREASFRLNRKFLSVLKDVILPKAQGERPKKRIKWEGDSKVIESLKNHPHLWDGIENYSKWIVASKDLARAKPWASLSMIHWYRSPQWMKYGTNYNPRYEFERIRANETGRTHHKAILGFTSRGGDKVGESFYVKGSGYFAGLEIRQALKSDIARLVNPGVKGSGVHNGSYLFSYYTGNKERKRIEGVVAEPFLRFSENLEGFAHSLGSNETERRDRFLDPWNFTNRRLPDIRLGANVKFPVPNCVSTAFFYPSHSAFHKPGSVPEFGMRTLALDFGVERPVVGSVYEFQKNKTSPLSIEVRGKGWANPVGSPPNFFIFDQDPEGVARAKHIQKMAALTATLVGIHSQWVRFSKKPELHEKTLARCSPEERSFIEGAENEAEMFLWLADRVRLVKRLYKEERNRYHGKWNGVSDAMLAWCRSGTAIRAMFKAWEERRKPPMQKGSKNHQGVGGKYLRYFANIREDLRKKLGARIVEFAQSYNVSIIVIENLEHFKPDNVSGSRASNKLLNLWAPQGWRTTLEQAAVKHGITIGKVMPHYTSKVDPVTRDLAYRDGECLYSIRGEKLVQMHADIAAAHNIQREFWSRGSNMVKIQGYVEESTKDFYVPLGEEEAKSTLGTRFALMVGHQKKSISGFLKLSFNGNEEFRSWYSGKGETVESIPGTVDPESQPSQRKKTPIFRRVGRNGGLYWIEESRRKRYENYLKGLVSHPDSSIVPCDECFWVNDDDYESEVTSIGVGAKGFLDANPKVLQSLGQALGYSGSGSTQSRE